MKSFNGKKPNFQKWDEQSFILDTLHLSWLGRLIYRALLQEAWYGSMRPDLPNDDHELRKILDGVPEEIWNAHRDEVRSMFQSEIVDEHSVLYQKRLRRDWTEIEDYRTKQAEHGKKAHAEKEAPAQTPQTQNSQLSLRINPDDVRKVSEEAYKILHKPARKSDVERLLLQHRADVIIDALRDFNDNTDEEKVEFLFFNQDEGAGGDIICSIWEQRHPDQGEKAAG